MRIKLNSIALWTIVRSELHRTFRLWKQTFLPTLITSFLYFLIFGAIIGSRIGHMQGFNYLTFIIPGLVALNVITSSFTGSVSAFYMAKFMHNIEELLVSPTSIIVIVIGFTAAGVIRGIVSAIFVLFVASFFTHVSIYSYGVLTIFILLTAFLFSIAGILNGMIAKTFDDIALIPSFVLVPLTYLGGVFFPITLLSGIWYHISLFNPITYLVSGFRFSLLGVSDYHMGLVILISIGILIALFLVSLYGIQKSSSMRP